MQAFRQSLHLIYPRVILELAEVLELDEVVVDSVPLSQGLSGQ
jgi:hypothetical protein